MSLRTHARGIAAALLFRLACYAAMTALAIWAELRPAPTVPDLGIDGLPFVPSVGRWNFAAWLFLYAPLSFLFLLRAPPRWIRYMVTGGLVSLVRGLTIPLTGLGVPDPQHAGAGLAGRGFGAAFADLLSPVAIFFGGPERAHLRQDLFFSGHTATTFLLLLYLWRMPRLRWWALAAHVLVVTTVLLAHLHYLIDVVAAYAFTFALFALREWAPRPAAPLGPPPHAEG